MGNETMARTIDSITPPPPEVPVLVHAKKADQLFSVRPKALGRLRQEVFSMEEPRLPQRVRAIPYGMRGWRYVARDIPLALAEHALARRAR